MKTWTYEKGSEYLIGSRMEGNKPQNKVFLGRVSRLGLEEGNPFSNPVVLFFLLYFIVTVCFSGGLPVHSRGEAREALIADSMYRYYNLILPLGYNGDFPSKPPFLHWLITIGAVCTGGLSEFSLRLPSALCSFSFLMLFYFVCRRVALPQRVTLTALVLTGFSVEWFRHSVIARVDMIHSASLASALLLYFLYRGGYNRSRILRIGLILCLTASFLSKGPVALILAALVGGTLFLVDQKRAAITHDLVCFLGIPALIGGLWYFFACLVGGQPFIALVVEENIRRFTGTMNESAHYHSVWYLLGTLLLGFFPGSFLMLVELKKRFVNKELKPTAFTPDSFLSFSFVCAGVITLFYCCSTGKRSVYLLAAYPFYAVVVANFIQAQGTGTEYLKALDTVFFFARKFLLVGYLTVGILLCLVHSELRIHLTPRQVELFSYPAQHIPAYGFLDWILWTTPLLWALMLEFFSFKSLRKIHQRLPDIIFVALFVMSIQLVSAPFLVRPYVHSEFSERLAHRKSSISKLYSYKRAFYHISFYSSIPMYLKEDVPFYDNEWILLFQKDLKALTSLHEHRLRFHVIDKSRNLFEPSRSLILLRTEALSRDVRESDWSRPENLLSGT